MKALEHHCYGEHEAMMFAAELRATGQYRRVRRWQDGAGNHIVTAWR